jgi:glycosyltransferase involved in cell wall biosynthesis
MRQAGRSQPAAGGGSGEAAGAGLRVVFVTRKWPPAMGGMETYSARLAERLRGRAALRVLALPGRADGAPPAAPALVGFGLRAAWALLAARRPADVLHLGDMASWALALGARLRGGPARIVLSAHGTDVGYPARPGWRARLYGAYLRAGARLLPAATVLANSRATAEAARGLGFRDVRVVPLATDMAPAAPPEDGPDPDRMVFAGRLVRRKGLGWFVREVLPRLPEPVTLDVAGTVWDAEEEEALDHPRVRFLGRLGRDALADLHARALCTVVPNVTGAPGEFEGFGLVATEAAAAGGVVLAADRDGLRAAVVHGETGFLLPSGEPEPWIVRIREIRGWSEAERAAFVARSLATVRRVYSWDRVAMETLAAYRG